MRRAVIVIFFGCILSACGGGGGGSTGSLTPVIPPNGGPPPVATPTPGVTDAPSGAPSPAPTFDPATVRITEYAAPATPQYLAAAPDGSVYFGYGANGSGSNLYRFFRGAFTQTVPAPPPQGYAQGGGVYGISAAANQVYWLSAYGGPGYAPYVTVECGGNGSASLCEPTVDEPTSMVLDAGAAFWVGGWAYNGSGMIATSGNAGAQFAGGIVQLVNGPGNAVWGLLQNGSSYTVAEFAANGSNISIVQQYALPAGDAAGSITYGGDGALWFTDQQRNAIGRMEANGSVTEYAIPTANALGQPWYGLWQITTACDGSVWFSEPNANKIGRIDASGNIAEFAMPTAGGFPDAISASAARPCAAPQVWVAEQSANNIAAVSF